jgi:hypothetical protein
MYMLTVSIVDEDTNLRDMSNLYASLLIQPVNVYISLIWNGTGFNAMVSAFG